MQLRIFLNILNYNNNHRANGNDDERRNRKLAGKANNGREQTERIEWETVKLITIRTATKCTAQWEQNKTGNNKQMMMSRGCKWQLALQHSVNRHQRRPVLLMAKRETILDNCSNRYLHAYQEMSWDDVQRLSGALNNNWRQTVQSNYPPHSVGITAIYDTQQVDTHTDISL